MFRFTMNCTEDTTGKDVAMNIYDATVSVPLITAVEMIEFANKTNAKLAQLNQELGDILYDFQSAEDDLEFLDFDELDEFENFEDFDDFEDDYNLPSIEVIGTDGKSVDVNCMEDLIMLMPADVCPCCYMKSLKAQTIDIPLMEFAVLAHKANKMKEKLDNVSDDLLDLLSDILGD